MTEISEIFLLKNDHKTVWFLQLSGGRLSTSTLTPRYSSTTSSTGRGATRWWSGTTRASAGCSSISTSMLGGQRSSPRRSTCGTITLAPAPPSGMWALLLLKIQVFLSKLLDEKVYFIYFFIHTLPWWKSIFYIFFLYTHYLDEKVFFYIHINANTYTHTKINSLTHTFKQKYTLSLHTHNHTHINPPTLTLKLGHQKSKIAWRNTCSLTFLHT